MSNTVYIVSAVRTPMGSFQGKLASVPATRLGSIAIEGALKHAGVDASAAEVFMGQVLQAGAGQAPHGKLPGAGVGHDVHRHVNKVCASGMKAIALGAQAIALGDALWWWREAWRT